jgi:cell division protein FtsL
MAQQLGKRGVNHMTRGEQVFLIIFLTIVGVVIINAAIVVWARRKGTLFEIEAMRKLFREARDPFSVEDNQLAELSRLVGDLKPADEKNTDRESTHEDKTN